MTLSLALALHGLMLVASLVYLRRRVDRLLSFSGLSLALLLLVHGVPVYIYLLWTGPESFIFEAALERVDREATAAQLPLALALMLGLFMLANEGAGFASRRLVSRGRRAARQQGRGPIFRTIRLGMSARALMWLVTLGMLAVSVVERQPVKIVEYFASGESELGKILLRVESGGSSLYAYNLLLSSVAPFLVMLAYCGARNTPRRRSLMVMAILLFFATLLGKFGTLSKAPPVIFLLQLLLLWILLQRKRINLRIGGLLLAVAATLFVIIVRATIPDLDLLAAFGFLYYRIFDIPNEVLIEYFAAVPATLPFGMGGGVFSFLRNVPDSQYVPMMAAVAEVTRDSLVSTSNAMFIGDAWAEFGWPGIASFSLLAGAMMRFIDSYAFRHGDSDESACLVAGGAYGIFTMLSTSLTTAMLTGGLILLPVLAFFLLRKLRRAHRPTVADPRPAAA